VNSKTGARKGGLFSAGRFRCIRKFLVTLAAAIPTFAAALDPNALPSGGAVASGAASISQAGNRLSVQQQSGKAILNWNTFNIGSKASVDFQQPGASSVVLNRVAAGGGVSEIYGSLTANGQVFLVNPAGTLFGRGAQVNVGGLVASTLDITNDNFLKGNYRFTAGGLAGSIVNEGTLTAAPGGYIALLAPQVRNEGVIAAQLGTVAIGSGNVVTLDIGGTGLVSMRVEQAAIDALIENKGLVQADGGVVYMAARAAGQLAGGVINNAGEIHAGRVTEHDGVIRLEAAEIASSGSIVADGASGGRVSLSSDGTTVVSGSVRARGSEGKGGEIRLLGSRVGLFGAASVDASGETGGGTVLVGGNYQGKGPEQNASITVVGSDASIRANAGACGDGGKVIVWSDETTIFAGTLQARGGWSAGNGGFAEVSGKQMLEFSPKLVDLKAANGSVGTLLLDPLNIIVATGTGAPYANVSTFAANPGTTQTIDPATLDAVAGNVSLQATNDITVTNAINLTTPGAGLDAKAGNNINVNASITTNNGAITLSARDPGGTQTAGGTVNLNAALSSTGGNINVFNNGSTSPVNLGANVSFGPGALVIAPAIALTAPATVAGASATFGGSINGANSLTVSSGPGVITFTGAVGNATPLASLSTVGGTTAINGGFVATTGTQTYGNPVTLGAATTLSSGGNSITLGSTVNGAQTLAVNTTGTTTFAGAVGNTTALTSLQTDFGGTTAINGGSVTTTGAQIYGDAVTLGATATILTGVNTTFQGTVNGPGALTVNDSGTMNFDFAVGGTTPLASLMTNAGGITAINGFSVTTTGAQTYGDNVTLGAPTTLTSMSGGNITLGGTVNNGQTLTVNTSGATTFNGTVGNSAPLASLTTDAGGTTSLQAVTTTGAQSYNDNATLNGTYATTNSPFSVAGTTTLAGPTTVLAGSGNVTFAGTVNGAAPLTINSFGTTNFGSAVGNSTALVSLITDPGGTTAIGGAVTTSGTQSYSDPVSLGAGATTLSAGTISINNSLNAVGGSLTLLASGPTGDISFNSSLSNMSSFSASAGRDVFFNSGAVSTGAFNVTAGRDMIVQASGSSANLQSGTMNLNVANALKLQGGTGTNAFAQAFATGTQTVNANTISVLAGAVGNGNGAFLGSTGDQTVNATSGIVTKGGPSGGVLNSGNRTSIFSSSGNQVITVGAGGLTLAGGGGGAGNTDNNAAVFQGGLVGTSQTINVNAGGSIVLTGGSTGQSAIGSASSGSFASITSNGGSQQVNFAASGSAITVTGGTVGSRNGAVIQARNGTQTITGSPTITITGGASGGLDLESNNAGIFANSGLQTITSGNLTISAGAGGFTNAGFMQAPSQIINVNGNLVLSGGGSTTGAVNGSGAGLGGRGGASATATNLSLTVTGDATLNGGSVANAGSSIGSGNLGGQPTDMTITIGGNLTLNPGTVAGARIGSPASNPAGGNIVISAGGAIAFNDSASVGTGLRTTGNVALQGTSISEGTNGRSGIAANALTTSTTGATSLDALEVGSLNATSGGPLNLGRGTISGALVATSNGNAITETGGLTVGGSATITAGAAPITLTSANDFQGAVTLSNSGANAIQVVDVNAFQLGTVTTANDLSVSGVGITQSGSLTVGGATTVNAGAGAIALGTTTNALNGTVSLNNSGANNVTLVNNVATILATSNVGSGALSVTSNGAIAQTGSIAQAAGAGTATFVAGANPITLTQVNDFTGTVLLSNSGLNAVQITDANTITFSNMTLGGSLTVNAPTIIAHDTTTTGNQLWNGSVTFNSTETTNGGSFTVTGTTTLGNGLTVNAGSGDVTFQGAVNGTQSLVVNTSGVTTFNGPVGAGIVLSGTGIPVVSTATAAQSISAQSALAVISIAPDLVSTSANSSPTSLTSASSEPTSSTGVAAATASAATAGPPPAPLTAASSSDSGTTRLTTSSGVSRETIRQIDQQIQQARTQMFSPALNQLARDPAVADVPDCSGAGQGTCVKEGKAKKDITLADSEPVIKRRVALLIGNDRYLAPIPALQTPIHDVEDIGKVLKERLGYEVRVVRNATKDDIVNELNTLVTEVDPDDSVIVYYAGHGYQAEKGGGGYWIPVDANNSDASGWISNSAISKFLANMASRQVMLISDSCYSGTLAQEQQVRTSDSTVFDRKEILRKRSVMVMSSGGNEPVADGGHDNHSLFAYHLLRSLNQLDGDLVGGDIHEKIRTAIVKEYPQDPQYGALVTAGHSAGGEYLIEKK